MELNHNSGKDPIFFLKKIHSSFPEQNITKENAKLPTPGTDEYWNTQRDINTWWLFPDIAGLRPSCKGPGRHGDIAPLNLTIRNNGLQINGNFHGNLKLEGKAPTGGRGSGWEWFTSLKRFYVTLTMCQATLLKETEAQALTNLYWSGPHLGQDCLNVHPLPSVFLFCFLTQGLTM